MALMECTYPIKTKLFNTMKNATKVFFTCLFVSYVVLYTLFVVIS